MQFDVRGATCALLSIVPAIFLTGCETTGSSPVTASGSTSAIANNPHPDLPANYRKQIADFMRTQPGDLLGLFPHAFPKGIAKGGAEIAEPNRKLGIHGMEDVVCVRFGGGDWPNASTLRAYIFNDGRLNSSSGHVISQTGVLIQAGICGWNPTFKPFPEAEFQPPQA